MVVLSKNKYDDYLIEILSKDKFLVSGSLCDLLSSKYEVSNTYARKILERSVSKGCIKSSTPATFGKGQFVYFLQNEKLNKDTIKAISKKFRPPLYRLLEFLDSNDGIISYYEALKITASPIKNLGAKIDLLDDLLEEIKLFDLIYLKTDSNNVKYIIYQIVKENEESVISCHFSKLKLDAIFVKDILDWLVRSNLILSLNNIYRNKNTPSIGAIHNNLLWDAFGYTKTTGINPLPSQLALSIEKQTLVVVDVLLSREYVQYDLDGFLSRIQINLNSVSKGTRKVMPIIIYRSCTDYILNKIKSLGFLCYDIGSIYGSNIFAILENISKLQLNQKLLDNEEFEKIIEDTLKTIKNSGQEDQLKALKGTLFEVMMYQLLRNEYSNAGIISNQKYNKTVFNKKTQQEENRKFEYDFIIKSETPKEILVIELKGYHSKYKIPLGDFETENSIKWFFCYTFPIIKEKYKTDIAEGYIVKGVYITSSNYEDDAIEYLDIMNSGKLKPKKIDVYYDRTKLLDLFEKNDFKTLKNIIEKFYL